LVSLPALPPGMLPAAEAATRDQPASASWKFPGLPRPAYAFQWAPMAVPFRWPNAAHWLSSMHLTLKMQASTSPFVPVLSTYPHNHAYQYSKLVIQYSTAALSLQCSVHYYAAAINTIDLVCHFISPYNMYVYF